MSNGYENAPSTRMLFQKCLVCGRPLRDAVSVEFGIGPTCRARCGIDTSDKSPERQACNKLIHAASVCVLQNDFTNLPQIIGEMHHLGFAKVAGVVSERFVPVEIWETEQAGLPVFRVKVPFLLGFGACVRMSCQGCFWVRQDKVYQMPLNGTNRVALWRCLMQHFPKKVGYGKKGIFVIP